MSELDLGQKVAARRMLWRMGYSTRIDVVLRAPELPGHSSAPESYTDVDVLGVAVTPSGEIQTAVVDCKTGKSTPVIGRMFWLRGLVQLFGANNAYMVRDHAISRDARQLAARLGITAVTEADVAGLENMLPTKVPVHLQPLAGLFDEKTVARAKSNFTGMDRKLKPLLDYRQFGYWVDPEHRNLVAMPDRLVEARAALQSKNPQHLGLLLDCAWLYLLSLARCAGLLRNAHISDLSYGLSEYLLGGTAQLRQQHKIADLLKTLQQAGEIPSATTVSVNPRFFQPLLELLTRLLRRGTALNDSLRLLEFQSASVMLGNRQTASSAFGPVFDRTAAKLAVDVVEFLVKAADLDTKFVALARDVLTTLDDPSATHAPARDRRAEQSVASQHAHPEVSPAAEGPIARQQESSS